MLVAGLALASCGVEELADIQTPVQMPTSSQKTFDVSVDNSGDNLSKARMYFRSPYAYYSEPLDFATYFDHYDEISIFANGQNNTFRNYQTNGLEARFAGNAEDADAYYALFPAQHGATMEGNVIKANVADRDSIGSWNNITNNDFPKGALCVGYSKGRAFSLKYAVGCVSFELASSYSELGNSANPDFMLPSFVNTKYSIFDKVVVEADDYIAGDVDILVGEDGVPVVKGGTSKSITMERPYANGFKVGMLPVSNQVLKVTFYRMDGETFTCEFPGFSITRNQGWVIKDFVPNEKFKVTFKDGDIVKDTIVLKGTHEWEGHRLFPNWTREGYSLKWLDEQGDEYVDTLGYNGYPRGIVSDRVFTAHWVKKEYENECFLIYPTKDGDKKIKVDAGYVFTLPELPEGAIYWENPKYPRHGSDRFYKDEHEQIYGRQAQDFKLQPGDKIQIWETTTLYPNQYNRLLTMDANGGKFEDGSSAKEWRFPDGLYVLFSPNYDSENMAFSNVYFDWVPEANQFIKKPTRDGYKLIGFTSYSYGEWKNEISWYGSYDNQTDCKFVAQWAKLYTIEYLDEAGNVAHTGSYIDDQTFELDYSPAANGKTLKGWMDQDGNMLRVGTNLISAIDEVKDLILTPVFAD